MKQNFKHSGDMVWRLQLRAQISGCSVQDTTSLWFSQSEAVTQCRHYSSGSNHHQPWDQSRCLQTILDQEPINYFWHLKQFLLKNNVNFIDLSVFGLHSIAKTDDDTKVKSVCCCVVLTMWNVTCNYQITNHPNLNVIFSNSALLDK